MPIKDLQTREIHVSEIKPAYYNPRRELHPGDTEYEKLKQSLLEFGYIDPIVWNEYNGRMIGGHQRYNILVNDLGVEKLTVSVVHIEDEEKERALNIALNQISGEWDEDKLSEILAELSNESLELTGFEDFEIRDYLEKYDPTLDPDMVEDDDFDTDAVAELIITPYVKYGDLWELGPHRLLCGDATVQADYKKLTDGRTMDMVFTDPPYNVDYTGKTSEQLKIENDKMADSEFYHFLKTAYSNMLFVTKKGGPIYVTFADTERITFQKAMEDAGWLYKQTLIWVKNTIVLGRQDYHWQHEPILYGWAPGEAHAWYGERNKSTIWDELKNIKEMDKQELIDLVNDVLNHQNTTVIRVPKLAASTDHPTKKPLALIAHYIANSSRRHDAIIDPFGGSGSTLIAADKMDRIGYLMEYDPRYAQVTIERYINHKRNEGHDVYVTRGNKRMAYHEVAIEDYEVTTNEGG